MPTAAEKYADNGSDEGAAAIEAAEEQPPPARARGSWTDEPPAGEGKAVLRLREVSDTELEDDGGPPPTLSEEEISEFKEAFCLFDEDGDGSITIDELRKVMYGLGSKPTDAELMEMIADVDEDDSGEIELPEFVIMMLRQIKTGNDAEGRLRKTFDQFDKNGDGLIDIQDLLIMRADLMALLGDDVSEQELRDMLAQSDSDGDGALSFDDFKEMMMDEVV